VINLAISSGNGTLDDNDGTWTYTPALDDDTSVTFSYEVTDGVAAPVATSASLDITHHTVHTTAVAGNLHDDGDNVPDIVQIASVVNPFYSTTIFSSPLVTQGVLEFDLSDVPGTLTSAVLSFDPYDNYYTLPDLVDYRVYSGNGIVELSDWDAGSLAASQVLTNADTTNPPYVVELDVEPINTALNTGDWLGINISMPTDNSGIAFPASSVTLDLFYI
jgi:hypothetical protein